MGRRATLRESRLMHAAVGATVLAVPASGALADAPAATTLQASLQSHRLQYGQAVVLSGRAPGSDAGQAVNLDFAPAGSTAWEPIASSQITSSGSFRLSAPLRRSGSIEVTTGSSPAGGPVAVAGSAATASSTRAQKVIVAAALRVRRRERNVLGTRAIVVHGQLLPRAAHHRVVLQGNRFGRWIKLAVGHTSGNGRFYIRYRPFQPGHVALRVRFSGDRRNAATTRRAGSLTVLHPGNASWYYDGGTTACGFHAHYGVANLSLPCGAKVRFSYGGRTVTAVVDDRGPYVGGREWDLNQNTAAALGFGGVDTVWASR